MTFEETVIHTCANCGSKTGYTFSTDLKYKVEPPFLCSEDCYDQYAVLQLRDDTLHDVDLYEEAYDT